MCRSAGVQFTFQNEECSMSRREAMLLRLTSSCNAPFPGQSRDVECTPDKKMRPMSPQPESPSGGDLSPWPQITLEDSCKILAATPPVQKQRTKVDRSSFKRFCIYKSLEESVDHGSPCIFHVFIVVL